MLKRLLVWAGFLVEQPAPAPAADATKPARKRNNGKGGRASVAIERECPHCQKRMKGPIYFKHVKTCKANPANAYHVTAEDVKTAAPLLEQMEGQRP